MKFVISGIYCDYNSSMAHVVSEIGGKYDRHTDYRMNPDVVTWIETHEDETDLSLIDIPDNATDFCLEIYDCYEYIIAVVDGKIVKLYS